MTDTERAAWASSVSAELASLWVVYRDLKTDNKNAESDNSTQSQATKRSVGLLSALAQGDAQLMLKSAQPDRFAV